MTSSITALNTSIVFDPIDPRVLKNSLTQINTLVASIGATFARLNYLSAVNDHARTLQKSINEAEKWRAELALLGQAIGQTDARLKNSESLLADSPSEADALKEEIQTAMKQLITIAKSHSDVQNTRFQAIVQPLPDVQAAIAELSLMASSVEAKRAEIAPKLIAAENDLKTVDEALKAISDMKLTDIAERSLKSIADTIALKGLADPVAIAKDPAAVVAKAGDLLKRTLGTVDESLTYLSLVENQARYQKSLNALRADDDRWALELVGMKARLDYLAMVGTLDQQRMAYAEHFSRLPTALGRLVDHLLQPDADLAAQLARLRGVFAAFRGFSTPR